MSILIDADTTFIVQGITGREAVNLTRECLDYGAGAKIVGGVTPGRLGREVHGVPVFDTVAQAVEHHGGADRRLGRHRPPRLHHGRGVRGDRERHQADRDRHRADPAARRGPDGRARELRGARIIGPNCLGIIVPDVIKMGGIGGPAQERRPGLHAGPDRRDLPLRRDDHGDVLDPVGGRPRPVDRGLDRRRRDHRLELRRADAAVRGRPADPGDRDLHRARRSHGGRAGRAGSPRRTPRLPIVAFMAGRFMDEMPGMSFGHAGTIVEGKEDTARRRSPAWPRPGSRSPSGSRTSRR